MNGIKSPLLNYMETRTTQNMNSAKNKDILQENLNQLDKHQLKLFYSILVHYWVNYKYFISKQNFFNMWCEFNQTCSEVDDSFPSPYDDHNLLKSFCHTHPFYFIDTLDNKIVKRLLCQHLNDRIYILSNVAQRLHTGDLMASYEYSNNALGLSENIEKLVSETEKFVKTFS